jgi:hypothetical protein
MSSASDAAQVIVDAPKSTSTRGSSYGAAGIVFFSAPRNRELSSIDTQSAQQNAGTSRAYDGLHCLLGALKKNRKQDMLKKLRRFCSIAGPTGPIN